MIARGHRGKGLGSGTDRGARTARSPNSSTATSAPKGMARSVVVVATSDTPAMVRIRAAFTATRIAEWFHDRGDDVVLMIDSVHPLRHGADARWDWPRGSHRQHKGIPRASSACCRGSSNVVAGPSRRSITGLYKSVLVEGDDINEPIADATRSILDGHIRLSRALAESNHYPAVDVLESISRVAAAIAPTEVLRAGAQVRELLARVARDARDLIEIDAYVPGPPTPWLTGQSNSGRPWRSVPSFSRSARSARCRARLRRCWAWCRERGYFREGLPLPPRLGAPGPAVAGTGCGPTAGRGHPGSALRTDRLDACSPIPRRSGCPPRAGSRLAPWSGPEPSRPDVRTGRAGAPMRRRPQKRWHARPRRHAGGVPGSARQCSNDWTSVTWPSGAPSSIGARRSSSTT